MRGGRHRIEGAIKPRSRREDPKIFLADILSNGPAPATLVKERGKARGFTKVTNPLRPTADEYRFVQRTGKVAAAGTGPGSR